MPRVVSIFFPDLPTDRIRRADPAIPVEEAIAVISKSGSKPWVSAADPAARKAGVHVGMPAARAQALSQGLRMIDADAAADAAALDRITMWALSQYSPIVAIDPPDGIVMDTEGADHLQGGEERMLTSIANRFRAKGLAARVAIADTWGAAHACARAINRETVVVPSGEAIRAVERLPISLLRLPEKIVSDLRTLGFRTIGELSATPRAPLTLRFGPEVVRRLEPGSSPPSGLTNSRAEYHRGCSPYLKSAASSELSEAFRDYLVRCLPAQEAPARAMRMT